MDHDKELEFIQRLSIAEERGKSNTYRLDNIESNIENMQRNETILEMCVKTQSDLSDTIKKMDSRQEKFDERLDSFDKTISKVNDSLTRINASQQMLANDVQKIKSDTDKNKENIEKVEEIALSNRDKGKFDISNFFFQEAPKYVALAVLAAVLTYFGLK